MVLSFNNNNFRCLNFVLFFRKNQQSRSSAQFSFSAHTFLRSTLFFIYFILALLISNAEALEIDVELHLNNLKGTTEDKRVPFANRDNIEEAKKQMSKFYYTNWADETLDVQIGVAKNSVILLLNNKKDSFLEYEVNLVSNDGKYIGVNNGYLAPLENERVSGIYISHRKEGQANPWKLSFSHKEKVFHSNIKRLQTVRIMGRVNSKGSTLLHKERAIIAEAMFERESLYGNNRYGRKEGNITLDEVDEILKSLNTHRGQVKLSDFHRKHYGLKRVFPEPQLVRFHNKSRPGEIYYIFNESEYECCEFNGVAYHALYKVKGKKKAQLIFEHKSNTEKFYAYDFHALHQFADTDDLLITGTEMYGVSADGFIAKLSNGKLSEITYISHNEEGEGGANCNENPFPCDDY